MEVHYPDVIPVDLLKSEQARITAEMHSLQSALKDTIAYVKCQKATSRCCGGVSEQLTSDLRTAEWSRMTTHEPSVSLPRSGSLKIVLLGGNTTIDFERSESAQGKGTDFVD